MTVLLRILASPVFSALWRPLAFLLGLVGFGALQRHRGARAAKDRQAAAEAKAVMRGAEGAAEAKADLRTGKTPQEVKDANDRKWR